MRNILPPNRSFALKQLGLLMILTQLSVFADPFSVPNSSAKTFVGISNLHVFSPIDTAFSIKISPRQKMMDEHTTLVLNLGLYKHLKYVKVYDLIGKNIFFHRLDYKPGIGTYKLNMASLRPGIYFCKVYSDKGLVETRRIIHF